MSSPDEMAPNDYWTHEYTSVHFPKYDSFLPIYFLPPPTLHFLFARGSSCHALPSSHKHNCELEFSNPHETSSTFLPHLSLI